MKNKRPLHDWNKALMFFCVFLLSLVRLYRGAAPFGLPALACAGADNPLYLLAFIGGRFLSDAGASGFFRGLLGAGLVAFQAFFFGRRKNTPLWCALASLAAGALVLMLRPSPSLALDTVLEAVFAGVFFVVFRQAKALLFEKYRRQSMTDGEALMLVAFFSVLMLSLADVTVGALSPAAAVLVGLSMAISYRYEAIRAASLSLASGLALLVFMPGACADVLCLSLSSAMAACCCRGRRHAIPLFYVLGFGLFRFMGSPHVLLWDVFGGGALFCLLPVHRLDLTVAAREKDRLPLHLKEKLGSLSDAFSAMAAMFAPRPFKAFHEGNAKAAEAACRAVCTACPAGPSCRRAALSALSSANAAPFSEPQFLSFCRKRSALRSEFAVSYRLSRQEALMRMALREEGAALAGQMTCLSSVLGHLADEETRGVCRSESAERALNEAFRRMGVRAPDVACGLWPSGGAEVTLSVSGCGGLGLCDTRIPAIIGDVMGHAVERIGVKPCETGGKCRLRYGTLAPLSVHVALSSLPLAEESGDAFLGLRIDERRYALILSDGMGTGQAAAAMSRTVVELSARLLSVGMAVETVVAMVNTLLLSRTGGRGFATLDMAVIDLETGSCRYVKNGAAEGCILRPNGRIVPLSGEGSPLGTIASVQVRVQKTDIKDGDMLILATDGAADALEAQGGLIQRVGEFTAGSAEDLASFIARGAYASFSQAKDDITVVAAGCIKRAAFGKDRHIKDGEAKNAPSVRKRDEKQRRIEA